MSTGKKPQTFQYFMREQKFWVHGIGQTPPPRALDGTASRAPSEPHGVRRPAPGLAAEGDGAAGHLDRQPQGARVGMGTGGLGVASNWGWGGSGIVPPPLNPHTMFRLSSKPGQPFDGGCDRGQGGNPRVYKSPAFTSPWAEMRTWCSAALRGEALRSATGGHSGRGVDSR